MSLVRKLCSWCQIERPLSQFYTVTRTSGKLRGQCKSCRKQVTRLQRDPLWRPPCVLCGTLLERRSVGGRRLCSKCSLITYDPNEYRQNGSKRLLLKPCIGCGGPKARFDMGRFCRSCRKLWLGDDRLVTGGRELERARYLFQTYGLSLRQFEVMSSMKNGCWICGRTPARGLAVDHDHGPSKRVRGLACHDCNRHRIASNTSETAKVVLEYLLSEFDGRAL